MRKKTKFVVSTTFILAVATASHAFAGGYAPANGTTTKFETSVEMDSEAEVPNATFSYETTAGKAEEFDLDRNPVEVFAGTNPSSVTIDDVSFEPGDATKKTDGKKTSTKTVVVDFSGCSYDAPGIYRYEIAQTGTAQGVSNDANPTRIADVYVVDDSTATEKKLKVEGYSVYAVGDESTAKSKGFLNEYDSSNLTIRKEVSGNKASRDKYFAIDLKISNATPDAVCCVDLSKAETTTDANDATIDENERFENPTTLEVGSDGTAEARFVLMHGQEVSVLGLPKGSKYSATENAEEYESTPAGVSGYGDPTSGTIESSDVRTSFLNSKGGVVSTGAFAKTIPYLLAALVGLFGIVAIVCMGTRRKRG